MQIHDSEAIYISPGLCEIWTNGGWPTFLHKPRSSKEADNAWSQQFWSLLRAIQSLAPSAKPLILVSSLKSGKIESAIRQSSPHALAGSQFPRFFVPQHLLRGFLSIHAVVSIKTTWLHLRTTCITSFPSVCPLHTLPIFLVLVDFLGRVSLCFPLYMETSKTQKWAGLLFWPFLCKL